MNSAELLKEELKTISNLSDDLLIKNIENEVLGIRNYLDGVSNIRTDCRYISLCLRELIIRFKAK